MPFITFEGGEGSGKTSQLALAAARLRSRRLPVVETREPGGTSIGEKIRAILLDVGHTHLDPVAEWLLYEADRRQHVVEQLRRDVASGAYVLCDRYSDTTETYQQVGRGIDADLVRTVDALARDGLMPDLTLVYDVAPEEGLARARQRDQHVGRFEGSPLEFHRRVRAAYLEIAKREPDRVRIIAAAAPAERVFEETWRHIAERFSL
ncbi:MAG TPA: dTMP kinase [Thermoanaerobaculia bacterium]|nr:dTMP kinase [Thermoanaerobaculia bacterium]